MGLYFLLTKKLGLKNYLTMWRDAIFNIRYQALLSLKGNFNLRYWKITLKMSESESKSLFCKVIQQNLIYRFLLKMNNLWVFFLNGVTISIQHVKSSLMNTWLAAVQPPVIAVEEGRNSSHTLEWWRCCCCYNGGSLILNFIQKL